MPTQGEKDKERENERETLEQLYPLIPACFPSGELCALDSFQQVQFSFARLNALRKYENLGANVWLIASVHFQQASCTAIAQINLCAQGGDRVSLKRLCH